MLQNFFLNWLHFITFIAAVFCRQHFSRNGNLGKQREPTHDDVCTYCSSLLLTITPT